LGVEQWLTLAVFDEMYLFDVFFTFLIIALVKTNVG